MIDLACWLRCVLIAAGFLLLPSSHAAAQVAAPQNPPGGVPVTATPRQPFIIDVFGGWLAHSDNTQTDTANNEEKAAAWGFNGWNAGATLGNRWLGLTSYFAQTYGEDLRITHLLVGPAVAHRFTSDGVPGRFFAHALAGAAFAKPDGGASETGAQFVLGGGLDAAIVRLEFDFVSFNLEAPAVAALAKNSLQFSLAAVIPFCFRHCSKSDFAFDVSGGK